MSVSFKVSLEIMSNHVYILIAVLVYAVRLYIHSQDIVCGKYATILNLIV